MAMIRQPENFPESVKEVRRQMELSHEELAHAPGMGFAARAWLHLPLAQLQMLAFLLLVFTRHGMVYLLRESGHFWRLRPSRWLLAAGVVDLALVTLLAVRGIFMTAVEPRLILALLAGYLTLVDFAKVRLLRWSDLA